MKDFTEEFKDLISHDIPLSEPVDFETGALVQENDLCNLVNRTVENGFVESFCLSNEDSEK